jgi:lipopolysaccharide export LptBFGC system permease protein LptF
MKKSYQVTLSLLILIVGICLLGVDQIFVSASGTNYFQSASVLTTIAVGIILIGALWLFKTTLKSKK